MNEDDENLRKAPDATKVDLSADDPSLYENHDESRVNKFDPEVANGMGMDARDDQEEE